MQGDIGFFQYKGKAYGQFFCAVQTFTKRIFVVSIRNLKAESLVQAIEKMIKVFFKYLYNILQSIRKGF